ncbi:patatin-like phospholipase family protein [Zhongshania arctica]|uniref:Patatin-like phospholipase family protein n=1 Tax=Zhongshania arctica TaxID=3238302 RepID=A0ABV3TYC5_9GAMM
MAVMDIRAGSRAYQHILNNGLYPADVAAMAGAAGGPKWLVLAALDKFLFSDWFEDRKACLPLVGASAGSWRFAALSCADPVASVDILQEAYITQCYDLKASPLDVSLGAKAVLDAFIDDRSAADIVGHHWAKPYIIVARSKGLLASDSSAVLGLGFAGALALNTLSRPLLTSVLQRVVFSPDQPSRTILGQREFPDFSTVFHPLTAQNLKSALLASGSIPFVMQAIHSIPACPSASYRDGGLIDYHIDLPLAASSAGGIVLMPHFSHRIIPGWLDKFVPWRRSRHADNVLLLSPSSTWIDRLRDRKIPDRRDFHRYGTDNAGRIRAWREAAAAAEELADFFAERLHRQDWERHLRRIQ